MTSKIQNTMTFTEHYDMRRIAYLYSNIDKFGPLVYQKCKNEDELKKEIDKLKSFLEYVAYHDGKIKVEYDTSKDGRLFGKPQTIQMISGIVRNFLLQDKDVVDVDIVNALSAVLLSVCAKYNIKCKKLKYYYENRQKIIDKYYDGDKDLCKGFINPAFFKSAEKIKTNNKFEEGIKTDVKTIQNFIYEHDDFEKYREKAADSCLKDNKTWNLKGRTLSYMYCDKECEILKEAMRWYSAKNFSLVRTPMFDGFIAPAPNDRFKLSSLNEQIKKVFDCDVKFIYKPIEQDIIPDVPNNFFYNEFQNDIFKGIIEKMKKTHVDDKLLIKPLPELSHKPNVEGNNKYLSNIFTYDMYKNNDVIVLQSCCGTGKTYSVSKYVADSNDKIISIVNRKSLLTAQINEFTDKGVKLNNYEDKETYDLNENGIICINSIMKYARQPDAHFNDFVVYIDEVNSFLETISHSPILTKDIKLVYETLIRIIKNCKKLIVSDHTITDAVFHLFRCLKKKRLMYVKNNFLKFKGVKSQRIRNEDTFKQKIEDALKSNVGFFAGFDSARTASQYFYSLKELTTCECILVTDETRVTIPSDLSEWEGKCIFYSPKIETGVDFSIDTKQQVFFHMKGQSVLPTSSFQMICRTRNMEKLTWYADKPKDTQFKYKSLQHTYELASEHRESTNLYMCSSYLDENDDIKYAPNSFYNIYTYNEYVKDIYENNKAEHLNKLLKDNGFECNEDVNENASKLDKKVIGRMKEISNDAVDVTFEQWINKEVVCEMYDIRSSILGLKEDEDKKTYKNYITDRQMFEEHYKITTLLKDNNHICDKANDSIENSYAEFGISNIYSKIKLLSEFEKQTNIKRFNFDDVKCGSIDEKTWTMIKKLFRKTTKKPEDKNDIIKSYTSMINNIASLYKGKMEGKHKKGNKIYILDTEKINESLELDFIKMTLDNPLKNYDRETIEHIDLELPKIEVDKFNNVIIDD
jgi:hypothetical protein